MQTLHRNPPEYQFDLTTAGENIHGAQSAHPEYPQRVYAGDFVAHIPQFVDINQETPNDQFGYSHNEVQLYFEGEDRAFLDGLSEEALENFLKDV